MKRESERGSGKTVADTVPRHYLASAANLLEKYSQEILETYENLLRAAGSPLVAEEAIHEQLRAQARNVLNEVVEELRTNRSRLRSKGEEDRLSAMVGVSRAQQSVHPSESLRAVVLLSEAMLSVVIEELPSSPGSKSGVAAVALAIQKSIMERVARASVAYGNYLRAKLHDAHADEQRRISRELHDRVAPSIMVTAQSLELHEMYEEHEPERARSKLELAKHTTRQALQATRDLSRTLRDSAAEGGLEVALSRYLHSTVSSKVQAWVSAKGDESLLTHDVRDEVYLILREAIRNAVAHSMARRIRVAINTREYEIRASVEDNGKGFDPETASSRGMGLASMRERVALLGGDMRLTSCPNRGTKIELWIPLLKSSQ